MHRVSISILLTCLSVNSLAIDDKAALPDPVGKVNQNWLDDLREQCSYDTYPILPANVSAEELILREIPSPPTDKTNMTGVCFSGGGSRSLAATRGEFAALLYLGYESKINYISMVSGGAWGAANYYALPDRIRKNYLGNVVRDISSLYWGDEDIEDDRNIAWVHRHSLGRAPQKLGLYGLVWYFLNNILFEGTRLWNEYLEQALLTPYGLDSDLPFGKELFPAKPDHLQLIVSAGVKDANDEMVPLELTPAGIGTRTPVNGLGDAYVLPPEGFGKDALAIRQGAIWTGTGLGFTLGDLHAVTSSNYVHLVPRFWNAMSAMGMAVPSFNWLNVNLTNGEISQKNHQVVDSGRDEYLGLMPLLARGMRRVIAFVNTDIPITKGEYVIGLEKVLPSYFGIIPDEQATGDNYHYASPALRQGCGKYCLRNQVFPGKYYEDLADNLWKAKKQGRPIVHLQKGLPLLDNLKYGVKGGGVVDILWVYSDLPESWFSLLNEGLQEKIIGSEQFSCNSEACLSSGYRFPHFDAITELNLSPVQVNMLFHLQAWTLLNSRELLNKLFDN